MAQDKQLRANARFNGLSIGEAIVKFGTVPYLTVCRGNSFIAKDKIILEENLERTDVELDILFKLSEYDKDTGRELLESNPVLYGIIKSYVSGKLCSELATAKRARHIGNVIKHVEAMSCEPRYNVIDIGLLDTVPY